MDDRVEISRLMTPDDANMAGNVHGGTLLKMIEDAGTIVATRHCNNEKKDPSVEIWAPLARVEHTDFIQPMYIGELATVDAEITYVANHSLEVLATVWAENLVTGSKRKTNRAFLWYVAVNPVNKERMKVPPIEYPSPEAEKEGKRRYEIQKEDRAKKSADHADEISKNGGLRKPLANSDDSPVGSISHSTSTLIYIVHPSDCNQAGYAFGGFTMKMMDNVAGIVAFRHCGTNIVTACIDAVDFHVPLKLGTVVTFTGRLTFTSARSMEIEVLVDAENILEGRHFRACSARFTFVALDKNRKVIGVPQLVLQTDDERRRFEEAKLRYSQKKLTRQLSK